MDVMFRYVCVAVFAVVGLNNVLAQEELYAELGEQLKLRAEAVSKPITGILWKIGNDFVAEWLEGSEPDYYRNFKGRTTLSKADATLVVNSLNESDAGVYSVEINSQVQRMTYMVKVIKAVPMPKVEAKPLVCSETETCDLVCEGVVTGAEPVTYSWKTDDGAWEKSGKTLIITKTRDNTAKRFSCQMENPVSVKTSEGFNNPFLSTSNTVGIVVGSLFGILAVVGVAVGVWKRKEIGKLFGGNNTDENPVNGVAVTVPLKDGDKSASDEPENENATASK